MIAHHSPNQLVLRLVDRLMHLLPCQWAAVCWRKVGAEAGPTTPPRRVTPQRHSELSAQADLFRNASGPRQLPDGSWRVPLSPGKGFIMVRATLTWEQVELLALVSHQAAAALTTARRLRRAQRAVERLAAGVAHELNTPLAAMILALELAGRDLPAGDARIQPRLRHGIAAGRRARDVVEGLLRYSRSRSSSSRNSSTPKGFLSTRILSPSARPMSSSEE